MKKLICLILSVLVIFSVMACTKTEEKIPCIIFTISITEYDRKPISYLIDNNGNVYYSTSNTLQCPYSEWEELYNQGKLEEYAEIINTIDAIEVLEKYEILKKIAKRGKYRLVDDNEDDLIPAVEVPQYWWTGYYYDKNERIDGVTLHGYEHYASICEDNRATEIARWITKACRQNPQYMFPEE